MCILFFDRTFLGCLHGELIYDDERLCRDDCFQFTVEPDIGWIDGSAPLSGIILCIILLIIVICSMQWIRRSGHFQVSARNLSAIAFPLFIFLDFLLDTLALCPILCRSYYSCTQLLGLSRLSPSLQHSEPDHAPFRNGLSVRYRSYCWKRRTHC